MSALPADEDEAIRQEQLHDWLDQSQWKMLKQTLQGYVCKTQVSHGQMAIVKKAFAELVRTNKSLKGAKVQENFLGERETLQYLNSFDDAPGGIVKLLHSWNDEHGDEGSGIYYYLQEYISGGDLFELTSNFWLSNPNAFQLLPDGSRQPVLQRWHENVADIFTQLVETICWMHSKGVIHLDISLENIMVEEVARDPRLPFGPDNRRYKVRVIDFGTAQTHIDGDFTCKNFHVGKSAYMAPEVHDRRYGQFEGRAADTWSLGVVLFQMLVGSQLYQKASVTTDPTLNYAMKQGIQALLRGWNRDASFPDHACDLLTRIFQFEMTGRISMATVFEHPYVELAGKTVPLNRWEVALNEEVEVGDVHMAEAFDDSRVLNTSNLSMRSYSAFKPGQELDVEGKDLRSPEAQFRSLSIQPSEESRLRSAMRDYGFTENDVTDILAQIDEKTVQEFAEIFSSYGTLRMDDGRALFKMMVGRNERIRGEDVLRFCVGENRNSMEEMAKVRIFQLLHQAGERFVREESDAQMMDAGDGGYAYEEDDRF